MRRITSILILLVGLTLMPGAPARALFFDDDSLVTIDDTKYTGDDFKLWWKFWNDDKSPLPETVDPYVEWLLLSQEGKRMELDADPGFKRQTRIFLQSRALLMLQNDAVISQIKVTDEDIKKRYEAEYQPRWLIKILKFKDEKAALAAWKELSAKKLTVDELLARKPGPDKPEAYEKWVRPGGIDKGWVTIFGKMKPGEIADPSTHKNGPVLYLLKDQKGGDPEDLAKMHADIERLLSDEQVNSLTQKLLTELRAKYAVKVDEKRLEALDISGLETMDAAADNKAFTDEPIITTNRQNVSEKEFIAVIRRLLESRPTAAHALKDKEESRKLKISTVNNIIAQSVTNWESLDRHYEEKEPFKDEYDFNLRHRLVITLEERLFVPQAKVTDEEIEQEYKKNIARYTQPTMVKLYIIDETQGPIDQIWADVATGESFEKVVKKHFGIETKPREAPSNHLDPEVKAVVEKLGNGDTSKIFKAQGIRVLAHLVERTPETPLPLEKVKESIRSSLTRAKILKLRSDFLDTLKSHSKIKVNESQWKTTRKEIEAEAAKQKEIADAKKREIEAAKQKERGGK